MYTYYLLLTTYYLRGVDMAHYFENDDSLERKYQKLEFFYDGERFVFETCSGVFSKDRVDAFSVIMVNCARNLKVSGRTLDLGCGFGAVGILLKKRFPEITLLQSDINRTAVELTRRNCKLNGTESEVVCSDCYDDVEGNFDWVFLNPPVHAGKAEVYRMFRETAGRLNPNGRLVLVIQKKHGAKSVLRELESIYRNVRELRKESETYVIECSVPFGSGVPGSENVGGNE
jgi:16S rRNA (guanine1207-N2)-methyltransferase